MQVHFYLKHQITCTHLPHQQDDSSLPLKTRQEHPAQHLWQIFYYIYLLKEINKWKGLWFKPGNLAFIAEAIRRLFLGSHHSPSANFAMQKSPLRGAKDPSTGGWAAISPRMLSIRFSSLVPAEMRMTKRWTSMQTITLLRKVGKHQACVSWFGSTFEDQESSWWSDCMIYSIMGRFDEDWRLPTPFFQQRSPESPGEEEHNIILV